MWWFRILILFGSALLSTTLTVEVMHFVLSLIMEVKDEDEMKVGEI